MLECGANGSCQSQAEYVVPLWQQKRGHQWSLRRMDKAPLFPGKGAEKTGRRWLLAYGITLQCTVSRRWSLHAWRIEANRTRGTERRADLLGFCDQEPEIATRQTKRESEPGFWSWPRIITPRRDLSRSCYAGREGRARRNGVKRDRNRPSWWPRRD